MSRGPHAVAYLAWLAWQVITSSVRLGRDVLTPGLDITPRIVRFPLRCTTDLETTLMASSITLVRQSSPYKLQNRYFGSAFAFR